MKRNKKFILLTVLLLTIGFAAVSTVLLINGNLTIAEKTSDYKIYFSSAIQDGLDKSNILISSDKQSIDYTIEDLTKLNQTSVLEYQVTNDSSQYDADIKVNCTLSDNEYVKATNSLENQLIAAKSQENGTLTVELIKQSTEERTVTLHCELVADAIERTEVNNNIISADTYTLSGYFEDEENQLVTNANLVIYSETPHYVTTDNYGYFAVTGLEKGEHEIYYLASSINEIKGMTKEEVKNNKVTETTIHTNKLDEEILFENNYKIVSVSSGINQPITYTIELDPAGGTLENTTYEVTENQVYGNLPTPTKKGYNFIGWYLDDKLITNTTYVIGTEITKLVAKYEAGEYQVTFNADGGIVDPANKTVTFNSTYGDLPIPVKIGYTFNGWFNKDNELITSETPVTIIEDEELIAKWTGNEFTVSASGYQGVYDTEAHGITVTPNIEDTEITYSLDEENYSSTAPTFSEVGTYTVYYKVTKYNYLDVTGRETVEITAANNTLTLSETSGTITYPVNGRFEVTNNTSGGTLSVSSSDTSKAIVSIANGIVTIKPGTTAGDVTITVTSAKTSNYKEASVTYTATIKNGTIDVITSGYNAIYDGNSHGISVSTTLDGATIKYSTDNTTFVETNPTFKDAGEYTVYYQVSKPGYETVTGSEKVTITKASNTLSIDKTSGTIIYPGSDEITVTTNASIEAISSNTSIASVKVENNKVIVKSGTTAGVATITINTINDNNHTGSSATYTATVKAGTLDVTTTNYNGTYDGNPHSGTLTVKTSGATVKYGTTSGTYNLTSMPTYKDAGDYTVYYQVSASGYTTKTGSVTVTINKANNTLELNATSGTITYPKTGSFTVSKNTSSGTLSVASSNTSIAIASISDKTVTVKPGTVSGSATITVTSAETTNYKKATATYTVTVKPGTLDVTTSNYTGTYDGNSHAASVTAKTSGATVKYGTVSGTYNLTSMPTYTNAGEYTVYYQVSAPGYTTKTGSVTITINKADNTLTLSATSGTIKTPTSITFTITTNTSNGALSVVSSDTNKVKATISGKTVTLTPGTTSGTAIITVTSAETTNYKQATATYTMVIPDYYIGDVVKIGNEGFHVIKDSGPTVTLFADYNLGTNYRQSTSANYIKFSNSNGWAYNPGPKEIDIQKYDGNAKTYVNNYVNYLKTLVNVTSNDVLTGNLITLTELGDVGCTINADYTWSDKITCNSSPYKSWVIKGQYYWTRSAKTGDGNNIWTVFITGELFSYNYGLDFGIRPVITVSKSLIKK